MKRILLLLVLSASLVRTTSIAMAQSPYPSNATIGTPVVQNVAWRRGWRGYGYYGPRPYRAYYAPYAYGPRYYGNGWGPRYYGPGGWY